jgi:hypothetical protein
MRLNGWEARLNAVVERHRVLPFGWHTSDCFTLPLDGVVAITGRDPWHGLHDYSDALSAARCMRGADLGDHPVGARHRGDRDRAGRDHDAADLECVGRRHADFARTGKETG